MCAASVNNYTQITELNFENFGKIAITLMVTVFLIGRLLLSGIFLIAGFTKWADRTGSAKSFVGFGLPEALAKAMAILLPPLEIAIGVCLIPAGLALYGNVAALCLLVVFILGIGVALARGRKPDCHCFGQLHSKPVGGDLLVRNIMLAAIPAYGIYLGAPQPGVSM